MRTLVDLLSNDHGYARIYAGPDSFGYELGIYRPTPVSDLFASMYGYDSLQAAYEAAQEQLSAVHQKKKKRKASRSLARAVAIPRVRC